VAWAGRRRRAVETFGGLDCAANVAAIETETETETTLLADCGDRQHRASTNSFRPLPKQAVYTATKHGVVGLTKTAAIEYAGAGIRINAVAPGAIDTPMLRGAMAARGSAEEDVLARLSLTGRFGQPAEIAHAVLWLCSDQSAYTMGHVLAVDGGYLAR
jgi:NAD(P)-dependent dehydrogenase (short-subunit alcohol dehydrogenase family)